MDNSGALRDHCLEKNSRLGNELRRGVNLSSATLHARSLAPLVKARGFGMTPRESGVVLLLFHHVGVEDAVLLEIV